MVVAELGRKPQILDSSANVIQSDGSKSVAILLLDRSEQALDLRPLGRIGRQSRQKVARGFRRVGAPSRLRENNRQVEARLVKTWIRCERGAE